MKLSDIPAEAPKHILLYGPPKTGKTLTAMKMAEPEAGYKVHVISGENGHLVGKQLSKAAQENIEILLLPDTQLIYCMALTMSVLFKAGKVKCCVEHGLPNCKSCLSAMTKPFQELDLSKMGPKDIIVVDTMTQWGNSILAMMAASQSEDWTPEFKDWRKLGTLLDMGLGSIQNSPLNWIVITHEISHEQQDGKEKIFPVAGTRNFSRNTAKYFDTVVYCEIVNGKHQFASRTTYKNNVVTGDRMNVAIESSDRGLLPIFLGDTSGNKPSGASAALANLGLKK